MPALVRAFGAALTTSWALPTPGKGQWPLHPQTHQKYRVKEHVRIGRAGAPALALRPWSANNESGVW